MNTPVNKSEEQWKKELTEEQYYVIRMKGTDRPYTGKYDQHWEAGTYECAACGATLFTSDTKFDAGCGWPSFYEALDKTKIIERKDFSHGMIRTEVMCANCGGHLGHVFDDGPKDKTGLRYCINSTSIHFNKTDSTQK
jgi:peptide-methionine (R)-S-oxide reductase